MIAALVLNAKKRVHLRFQQAGQKPCPLRQLRFGAQKIHFHRFLAAHGHAIGGDGQPFARFDARV